MKIIDLFQMIANDEKVPKKIKYKDWLYDWNEIAKDYECGNDWLEERICKDFKTFLNDEVEIIEEDKEIEKIELDGEYIVTYTTGIRQLMNTNKKDRDIYIKKINQLIDKVNSLENKQ